MTPTYFINPAIDALATATGEERRALVRLIAANVGDESTLRAILGLDPEEFSNFYPDMRPPELTTEATISAFISRFSSEDAAHAPEIEEIVAAPVVDYAALVAAEEENEGSPIQEGVAGQQDSTSDAISAFLAAVPPKTPGATKAPRQQPPTDAQPTSEPASESASTEKKVSSENGTELSEALFKMMVKNKNYHKALEIINELSLKNPKKSIYFAYQIRFLEKLIKNQEKAGK